MEIQHGMQIPSRPLQLRQQGNHTILYFKASRNPHNNGIQSTSFMMKGTLTESSRSNTSPPTQLIMVRVIELPMIVVCRLKKGLQYTLQTYMLWPRPLPKYFPPQDLPRSWSIQRMIPNSHYPRLSRKRIS